MYGKSMTKNDVTARLAEIRIGASNDEQAHFEQDCLYVAVLEAIANGTAKPSARVLAQEALKVRDIEFSRWYA